MKPSLDVTRTSATSTSGTPLLYDSGILYDDPEAYYDLYYPASSSPFDQGEIPTISASAEKVGSDSSGEDIKIDSASEKVGLDSRAESVKIKNVEEF